MQNLHNTSRTTTFVILSSHMNRNIIWVYSMGLITVPGVGNCAKGP